MPAPIPNNVTLQTIKSRLLEPALTSHFICRFSPPSGLQSGGKAGFYNNRVRDFPGLNYIANQELIELSCTDASLPGSSLATIDIDNDFHGVSEKHAYRRLYDDRADFTFIVDGEYKILDYFENWISYCSGESSLADQKTPTYSYRVNYPKDYKTDKLYITKFDRNISNRVPGNSNATSRSKNYKPFTYTFVNAYPISIASMPVSYDTSNLLKCTVSFFYSRYVIGRN
jgi:hypothetical protein